LTINFDGQNAGGAHTRHPSRASNDSDVAFTSDIVLGLQTEDGVVSALPVMPGSGAGAGLEVLELRTKGLETEVRASKI